MEEVAVYGFMTPLKLKIIVALALTDTVVRDQDMLIVRLLLFSNRSLTVWLSCIHIGCYRCSKPSTPPTPSRSQTRFSGYIHRQRVAALQIPALHCLPRRMQTRANRRHSRSEWMKSRERSSGTNERSFTHVSSCYTLNKVSVHSQLERRWSIFLPVHRYAACFGRPCGELHRRAATMNGPRTDPYPSFDSATPRLPA